MELDMRKCEVLAWSGELPSDADPDMARAGMLVDSVWEPGFLVYGMPVGTDIYVEKMLEKKVDEIEKTARMVCEVMEGEEQTIWTILRMSIMQQFNYWLQLVHPTQIEKAAGRVNRVVWEVLENILGFSIPQSGNGFSYTCLLDVDINQLRGKSFQSILASLPLKLGGMGLRDQVQLSLAAYEACTDVPSRGVVGLGLKTDGPGPEYPNTLGLGR